MVIVASKEVSFGAWFYHHNVGLNFKFYTALLAGNHGCRCTSYSAAATPANASASGSQTEAHGPRRRLPVLPVRWLVGSVWLRRPAWQSASRFISSGSAPRMPSLPESPRELRIRIRIRILVPTPNSTCARRPRYATARGERGGTTWGVCLPGSGSGGWLDWLDGFGGTGDMAGRSGCSVAALRLRGTRSGEYPKQYLQQILDFYVGEMCEDSKQYFLQNHC
jgi:hypothetical protein